MVTPTSTPSNKRLATPTAEYPAGTPMLMPPESSNRFSTLLMLLDSAWLTPVSLLLQFMTELPPPSTLSLLLPQPSTQSFQLLLKIPLRLLKLRLLMLLPLRLLRLLLLTERSVMPNPLSLMDSELLTQLTLLDMLVFLMLLAFLMLLDMLDFTMVSPTTVKHNKLRSTNVCNLI